jgi:sigma-B regulation protein RsbU (phosphoserine phosphatase)
LNAFPETAALFEALLRHVPGALLVVNAEGRILFSSNRATHLFGYSGEAFRSSSIVSCLPDWFTLPAAGSVLETNAVDSDGRTFAVELSLAPLETSSGPLLIALIRDSISRTAELAGFATEQEHLREQIQELSLRERDLKSEMNQAARILEAHLPAKSFKMSGLQVAWRFSPCFTLGGDMVKLFPVSDNFLGFCILDVSGHGIPASLLAISLARSLSTDRTRGGILETSDGSLRNPTEILTRLNRQYQILHEGEQFVTLLYGILDMTLLKVRYVSAGHPHPLLISDGKIRTLEGPINPPIGVVRSLEYEETVVQLSSGDSLLLYTDGVTETRSPSGEMFGEERLIESLRTREGSEPDVLLKSLYGQLERFRSGREQTDDVTSLILKMDCR